jgi:hypothetical protein
VRCDIEGGVDEQTASPPIVCQRPLDDVPEKRGDRLARRKSVPKRAMRSAVLQSM